MCISMGRKKKQSARKKMKEWEKERRPEGRRLLAGARECTSATKRKVADTSFGNEDEQQRGKRVGEEMKEGYNGNCKEIVELITKAIRKEREIWKEEMRKAREL